MSWFSGILPTASSQASTNSSSPAPTALQQQRRKQIDSLRSFHHTVTEVRRDVEYQITFSAGSNSMSLNVILPPQFPNEKPVVTVSPPCSHPWISDQMIVVGCSSLNAFYMHSNLGKVLQDVVKEFCEHPPQMTSQPALRVPQSSAQSSSSSPSTYTPLVPYAGCRQPYVPLQVPSLGTSSTNNPLTRVPFPPSQRDETISTWQNSSSSQRTQPVGSRTCSFPELASLSLGELKLLNEDPELCLSKIKLDEVEGLKTKREELMRKNEDIAKKNMSAQPVIEAYKDALLMKYEELTSLKQDFDILFEKQQELLENFSFTAIQNNLQINSSKVDAEAEEIAEQFLEGTLSIDKFLPKFMEKRRLYHSRLAKEEKILQLKYN